ncbi:phage integrase [Marinobacterium nitratireducens]|uniref:Phage integrase n=1 Tax=Marinobacterium nitratireducens TaxID=518897 RepID=A0A918DTD5_9GAMM|nr:site-specific integrase [Marinobacterium nitratireducens]GGO81943.1 phage integrase [Marinobacterium nitratireducens]
MAAKNDIPATNPDSFCKSIKATQKTQYFKDSKMPGLRLRVTPAGGKFWVFGYSAKIAPAPIKKPKDNYVNRSMSLGPFNYGKGAPVDSLTVKEARDLAAEHKARAKRGEDPAADKKRTELDRISREAARVSVRDVFEQWCSDDLVRRKDGGAEARRMMEKDVLPVIGELGIEDVRKLHISTINSTVKKRGLRIATAVFSLMRQLFGYAVERDFIEQDPTASIKKSKVGSSGEIRERVLNEKEIRELFQKLPSAGLVGTNELALPIQFATCCRIGELLKARWGHVDLEARIWRIPSENSKNGKAHEIYLSDFALDYFQRLHQLTSGTAWLFPAARSDGHINEKAITKQVADRQRAPEKVLNGRTAKHAEALMLTSGTGEQWRPHDLRRTGASLMVELGVLPEVAERCLNHTEQSKVKRTYQQFSYWPQMREAWSKLGDRLELLSREPSTTVVVANFRQRQI